MHYGCIVAGTDGSRSAIESVRQAAAMAAESGAALHLVGAYRDLNYSERFRAQKAADGLGLYGVADPKKEIDAILEDTAYAIRDYQPRLWLHAVKSDPGTALTEVAARKGAGVIVVGNRGINNPMRRVRPPVCDRVRKLAGCDVIVVDTAQFWAKTV
jgi:nucleotide-binding universal stress UspA family protein